MNVPTSAGACSCERRRSYAACHSACAQTGSVLCARRMSNHSLVEGAYSRAQATVKTPNSIQCARCRFRSIKATARHTVASAAVKAPRSTVEPFCAAQPITHAAEPVARKVRKEDQDAAPATDENGPPGTACRNPATKAAPSRICAPRTVPGGDGVELTRTRA